MSHKKYFFFLVLTVISCSEKGEVSPTPVASISFTANGTAFNWIENEEPSSEDYMSLTIIQAYGGGRYSFEASNTHALHLLPSRSVYFNFSTPTPSLATGIPYSTNMDARPFTVAVSTAVTGHAPPYIFIAHEDDFGTITFTKIHDTRADGTFTARLSHIEDSTKIDITEGKFENVEIIE